MLYYGRNEEFAYVCTNGTPASGTTETENIQKCNTCNDAYFLEQERCVQNCTIDDFTTKLQEEPSKYKWVFTV